MKPGYLSSEFAVTLLGGFLATYGDAVAGMGPKSQAVVGGLAAIYTIGRSYVKAKQAPAP